MKSFLFNSTTSSNMYRLLLISFVFNLIGFPICAQTPDQLLASMPGQNFYTVQAQMNKYYANYPGASGFKQWQRLEHYLEPRVYPSGVIFNFEAKNTQAFLGLRDFIQHPSSSRSSHGTWSFHGPNAISGASMGRLNCIDFDPDNANIIYVGSSSGGVWRSTNGGTSWTSISPNIPSLAIADIEIDPNDSDVIYIMTGDLYNNGRPSIGMLKSTDAGNTWNTTGLTFSLSQLIFAEKILMHPTNADIQYVATNVGLLKTSDGWTTVYNPATDVSFAGQVIFDVEFEPGDPTILYTSLLAPNPVQKSTTSGALWNPLTDPLLTSILGNMNKVEIAVTPDNPNCIYAHGGNGGSIGLLRSLDGGTTWQVRDTAIGNLGVQSGYNMSLVADSTDFNHIYLGQVWTKRSTTGGWPGSWTGPTNYVHADVHESKFHGGAIYHCNDGGLFKSVDDGATFTELSQGMAISEIYRICGTPQAPGLMYAGLQDNGSIQRSTSGIFQSVTGNDGTACLINYSNSNIAYTSSQNGTFYKTTNGGGSFTQLVVPQEGTGDFLSPMLMDPVDPSMIFVGLQNVWRSDNGLEPGSFYDLGSPPGSGAITQMAQSESLRSTLYVSAGSALYRTTNGLSTTGPAAWTQVNNELPSVWITGIAIDPSHNGRLFVTFGGYNDTAKVFFSDQWGNSGSWQNLTGNLPNVPVNCIEYHANGAADDALYIGTDIGVFYRDSNLGDWVYFSNYMPSVRVNDLYINITSNQLVAGTYGRGMWISDLFEACDLTINLNGIDGGHLEYNVQQSISSSVSYVKEFSSHVEYTAGDFIDLTFGFDVRDGAYLDAKIGPCTTLYSSIVQSPGQLITTNFIASPQHQNLWIVTRN